MSKLNKVDFYGGKPSSLPRFVYRRLAKALQGADAAGREAALAAAIHELNGGGNPDLRKFKFTPPERLLKLLTPEETARLNDETAAKRKHAAQLRMVYPHVADEFGLSPDFLDAALGLEAGPPIARGGSFFTIGSCFARNIAEFLRGNGVEANTFALAEDLNSPISNAFVFHLLQQPAAERIETLVGWVSRIFPQLDAVQARETAEARSRGIDQLAEQLAAGDCIVLTLGNVVDFFSDEADAGRPLLDKTFPKFVAMPGSEDIGLRANAAANLKKLGATLRLASYAETVEAIEHCIEGIRSVTAAPLVVTLSPVPVDSVIGLASPLRSAVEVDCVSKSRLRSAFDEVAERRGPEAGIHYFPSFEIVRWIAPMLPIPNFGLDDAASRHVSSPILDAICATFLNRFLRWTPAPEPTARPLTDA